MATLFLESDGLHLCSSAGNSNTPHSWTPANGVNTTTSFVWSATAVTLPSSETIDGIVMMCRRLNTTGTVTIAISSDGGSTILQQNTYPVSALPATSASSQVVFLLSTPITGNNGSNWKVAVMASSANNAVFDRINSTTANWYFTFRRTTIQSLAATDSVLLSPGITPTTGSQNSVTLTWTDTTSTTYGGFTVCQNSSFVVPSNPNTNYTIKVNNNIVVRGGLFRIGNSEADPIPLTSSVRIEFVNSANVDFGFQCWGGSVRFHGIQKTSWALLNANAAAGSTTLTLDRSPVNWRNADEIVIGPTRRLSTEFEVGSLNGNVSGSSITVTGLGGAGGGLATPKEGNASTGRQAEVINLTRNIKLYGTSSTLGSYFVVPTNSPAEIILQYVEFYFLGSSTSDRRGVEIRSNGSTIEVKGCSFHRCNVGGACGLLVYSNNVPSSANIDDCCSYMTNYHSFYIENISPTGSINISKLVSINGSTNTNYQAIRWICTLPLNQIRVSGNGGFGLTIEGFQGISSSTGVNVHSNAKDGIQVTVDITNNSSIPWNTEYDFSGYFSWRNAGNGIYLTYSSMRTRPIRVKNLRCIGNTLEGFRSNVPCPLLEIKDSELSGETLYPSAYHIFLPGNMTVPRVDINNINFGTTLPVGSGTYEIADIVVGSGGAYGRVHCRNSIHTTKNVIGFDTASPPQGCSQFYWDGRNGEYHGYIEAQVRRIYYDTFIYNQEFVSSYENNGGKGNRTSSITATAASGTFASGTPSVLVDGSYSNAATLTNGGVVLGKWIKFDFGASDAPIITEAIWRQSGTTALGVWQWQGSNDDTNWTNIGNSFTLGGATIQTQTELSNNTSAYRYYRLNGVSGTMSNASSLQEIEFKLYYTPVGSNGIEVPPTQKIVPQNTNMKATSAPIYAFVNSGETKSFTIKIRKTDGRTEGTKPYSGAQPRIILKENDQLGINSDTVVATMSAAPGVWETFSITTPSVSETGVLEYVVDCDGIEGWINVIGV